MRIETSQKSVIEAIVDGDRQTMKTLYLSYKGEFCNWLKKKYLINQDAAIDVYQESFTIFFEKVKAGRLDDFNGDIKAYVFGIGKNKMMQQRDQAAKDHRHAIYLSEHLQFIAQDEVRSSVFENAAEISKNLMAQMGEPCKSILQAFYFYNLTMEQIAEKFSYKTEGVARTTKKRCMQKIKELVFKDNHHG